MNGSGKSSSRSTSKASSSRSVAAAASGNASSETEEMIANRNSSRRIAIVLVIATAGGLVAYPFRSDTPLSKTELVELNTPTHANRIVASAVGPLSRDPEAGPPLPGRLPFANRPARGDNSPAVIAPLPQTRDIAPPAFSTDEAPYRPASQGDLAISASQLRSQSSSHSSSVPTTLPSARLLPDELRQLARDGRWPVEARPLDNRSDIHSDSHAPIPLASQPQPTLPPSVPASFINPTNDSNAPSSPSPNLVPSTFGPPTSRTVASLASDSSNMQRLSTPSNAEGSAGAEAIKTINTLQSNWRSVSPNNPPTSSSAPSLTPNGLIDLDALQTLPSGSMRVAQNSIVTPTLDRSDANTISNSGPINQGPRWRVYKVRDGDSMESIALKMLGDVSRVEELYQANRDLLPPGGALPIGASIVVPAPR